MTRISKENVIMMTRRKGMSIKTENKLQILIIR
jgi:hypothetical protein